jgi:hypothetical protein
MRSRGVGLASTRELADECEHRPTCARATRARGEPCAARAGGEADAEAADVRLHQAATSTLIPTLAGVSVSELFLRAQRRLRQLAR